MKQLCCPLVEIVVSVAYAWRAPDTPFLLPFRPRFIAHRARSDSIALAGYPAQKEFKARLRRQNKKDTRRCLFVLAEKERFELSRRVYPTYTLSRGASSANLSTSPCSNQGFIPCGSPFFKSAPLLYPILLLLSISFLTFPLFIFDFSALSIEIILRVCYNYPNGLRVHYRSKEIFYEQQQSCGLRMSLA